MIILDPNISSEATEPYNNKQASVDDVCFKTGAPLKLMPSASSRYSNGWNKRHRQMPSPRSAINALTARLSPSSAGIGSSTGSTTGSVDDYSDGGSIGAMSDHVNARYKTELCRPFEESGSCKYGEKCQFAHGRSQLRPLPRHPKYKTQLCRTFHSSGFCPYGPRCHFVHNDNIALDPPPFTEQYPGYKQLLAVDEGSPQCASLTQLNSNCQVDLYHVNGASSGGSCGSSVGSSSPNSYSPSGCSTFDDSGESSIAHPPFIYPTDPGESHQGHHTFQYPVAYAYKIGFAESTMGCTPPITNSYLKRPDSPLLVYLASQASPADAFQLAEPTGLRCENRLESADYHLSPLGNDCCHGSALNTDILQSTENEVNLGTEQTIHASAACNESRNRDLGGSTADQRRHSILTASNVDALVSKLEEVFSAASFQPTDTSTLCKLSYNSSLTKTQDQLAQTGSNDPVAAPIRQRRLPIFSRLSSST